MEQEPFNYRQARAFAGQYGLVVGLIWAASFFCAMYAPDHLMLGHTANLMALASIFVAVKLMNRFSSEIAPLKGIRKWWMSWHIAIYAALITTLAQYIYFRFIDRGHLCSSLLTMLENPDYRQILEPMMQGEKPEALVEVLSQTSPGELTLSFIMLNIFAAIVFSLLCSLFVKGKS